MFQLVDNGQTSADRNTGDSIEWSTAFQSPEFIAGLHEAMARAMAQTRGNPTSEAVPLETLGATTPGTQSSLATGELPSVTPGMLIALSFISVSGPISSTATRTVRATNGSALMPYKWDR